jgi:hypothetical protein
LFREINDLDLQGVWGGFAENLSRTVSLKKFASLKIEVPDGEGYSIKK